LPLRNDKDVVLAAVSRSGRVLMHVSEALRNDKDVVLAAVNQCGEAVEHASEKLRIDRDVCWLHATEAATC